MCYGGAPKKAQERALHDDNPAVVVATPGRFKNFIKERKITVRNVSYAVLYEAGQLLDIKDLMGFKEDVRWIVEQFKPKAERRTLLFSSDSLTPSVTKFARTMTVRDPIHIEIRS